MRWPLYEHVIFDFDSTLTGIEGIDVLAEQAGVGDEVAALTQQAMDGSTQLESVYEERLTTIQPTRGEIVALKEQYRKHITEDAAEVVGALQALGQEVYIVSGGLIEPIIEVGTALGIPAGHIEAVEIQYDEFSGEWWMAQDGLRGRDKPFLKSNQSALEKTHGKAGVIEKLLRDERGRSLLVGDGTSDLAARSAVDLFIGYTGIVERQRIVENAPVLLRSRSLAPVLILSAGMQLTRKLKAEAHQALVRKACKLIDEDSLAFNDTGLGERFQRAYKAATNTSELIFR